MMPSDLNRMALPPGTRVVHKRNPAIRGVVAGREDGEPARYNVRLKLISGKMMDVTPYALRVVPELW